MFRIMLNSLKCSFGMIVVSMKDDERLKHKRSDRVYIGNGNPKSDDDDDDDDNIHDDDNDYNDDDDDEDYDGSILENAPRAQISRHSPRLISCSVPGNAT